MRASTRGGKREKRTALFTPTSRIVDGTYKTTTPRSCGLRTPSARISRALMEERKKNQPACGLSLFFANKVCQII
jgi:hypothetical protein